MFYSLLGRTVWFGLKIYLRRRYGSAYRPKPLLAGATVAVGVAIGVAVSRARSDDA
jgi:hypothetical protein